tara:strand:+ start:2788 stop:3369 length:582 start_codon:yes stop_codon:yes gene_type:complete
LKNIRYICICFVLFSTAFLDDKIDNSKIDTVKTDQNLEYLPDEFLKDLDNKKNSIYDLLDGRPALISFWFLACEPCKKEMKYLDEFNKKYADTGFQVISINTDGSRALSSVEPFVKSKKYSFKVLSDPRSKYQRKLKGTSCPFTVMVDHRGVIKSRHVGYNPGDEKKIEQEIIELIKQANPDTLRLNVKTEQK